MLPHKKEQLLALLLEWEPKQSFDIVEIANLLGVLENHTKCAQWARCWHFALQNCVWRILHACYEILSWRHKQDQREHEFRQQLPSHLQDQICSLVAREKVLLLWNAQQWCSVNPVALVTIQHIHSCVQSTADPWEVPIGPIIPRQPHFWSRGDASLSGGGTYCLGLSFGSTQSGVPHQAWNPSQI